LGFCGIRQTYLVILKGKIMGIKYVAVAGGVVGGIILGAVGMEILKKTNPDLVEDIENKVKEAGQAVKDAFEGKETVEEA